MHGLYAHGVYAHLVNRELRTSRAVGAGNVGMGQSSGDQNDRCERGHAGRSQVDAGRERRKFQLRAEFVSEYEGQLPWVIPRQL